MSIPGITSPPPSPSTDAAPPLLALPDSVLALVVSRLPSPDKKAARLVCRALHAAVGAAVSSFLLTDSNLPLLAPLPPDTSSASQQPPQPAHQHVHNRQRKRDPLHLTFPNLTHLCLALSPATTDPRATELLRRLLRTSLPALRCLRCLDLSLAIRDVVLGRTVADLYDTWSIVVDGLPAGRPVRVLVYAPAALPVAALSAATTSTSAVVAWGGGTEAPRATGGAAGKDGGQGRGDGASGSVRDPSSCGGVGSLHSGASGEGGGDTGMHLTTGGMPLLAAMLALLAARRPAAEVRLVTAPLASKRYDKPRIPSYDELVVALTPSTAAVVTATSEGQRRSGALGCCPVVTGLVLGHDSFDPSCGAPMRVSARSTTPVAAAAAAAIAGTGHHLIPNPLQQLSTSSHHAQPNPHPHPNAPPPADPANPGALRRAAQQQHQQQQELPGRHPSSDGDGLAWLPLLNAVTNSAGTTASLEQLTLWETWPLAALLRAAGGGGGGGPSVGAQSLLSPPPPSCLLGLRRLVLIDQQAVLNRDRLSADALAPLALLPHLTRLELASLSVSTAAVEAAKSGTAGAAAGRRSGAGAGGWGRGSFLRVAGSGGGGVRSRSRSGGAAARVRSTSAGVPGTRALPFAPLPQVRHLSVYHALRITCSPDGDADGSGGAEGGVSSGPLAALFPGLTQLSACVTHGSPGRPASERWGYLAGLGTSLRSLHLRALAAEDLCLQGRSEVLAALTGVTALRMSAESGKIDGLRSLARTVSCLAPHLVSLRLSHLATRGTDPRVSELALPRLTRLDFLGCAGDLVAAWDGLALTAGRLRRMTVRECDTIRPADLQWVLERQMGLRHLVVRDCPGLTSRTALAALRAARPSLALSACITPSAEWRTLRRSRRAAGAAAEAAGVDLDPVYGMTTADDLDEL